MSKKKQKKKQPEKGSSTFLQSSKGCLQDSSFIGSLVGAILSALITILGICYIESKNREINLMPYLDISVKKANDIDYGLMIRNTGKGPAIIKSGYIDINGHQYHFDKISGNIWENGLSQANITSNSLIEFLSKYAHFKKYFEKEGITSQNICQMFAKMDFIPTVNASIKDGEEAVLLSFPMQTSDSHIIKEIMGGIDKNSSEYYDNPFTKGFKECQDSFRNSISEGVFKIKVDYISLNKNEYNAEQHIKFNVKQQ